MRCEYLEQCLFYNDKMPMGQGIGSIFKKKYCEGNRDICARYLLLNALGPSAVPNILYPNMLDTAREIIGKAGEK